jgi:hypothetical protein
MAKETFYEALNKNYSKLDFEKMKFKLDGESTMYGISFNENCSNLKESFEKEGVTLNMIFPWKKEVTNEDLKKSLLSRIYHNGRKI